MAARNQRSRVRGQKAGGNRNAVGGKHGAGDRRRKRIALAQNFLTSETLVRRLVRQAGVCSGDTVFDIGAGLGIITAELSNVAGRVIAIEKDPRLARALRARFRTSTNVQVVESDFLRYRVPLSAYRVFASIPYNLTTAIVRKLLESGVREAHLIMQKEAARRFTGSSLFSLLATPFFEFKVVHYLRRTDFYPVPDVDSVVLRISRRDVPLVDAGYRDFVGHAFARCKPNLRLAYKDVFTYKQWKRLSRKLGFGMNATATELTFEQWIGLYGGWVELTQMTRNNRISK